MVKQSDVDDACQRLRIAGERPTLEKVRALLENGGSNRDVGPLLTDWKNRNDIPDWQVDVGPSSEVVAKFDKAAAAIWEAGRSREAAAFGAERAELEAKLAASQTRLTEALTKLAEIERELRDVSAEREVLQVRLADMSLHQDRRAREFWDRVTGSASEILRVEGALSTEAILKRLPAEIRREWPFHDEPLTVSTLREKLKERSRWARHVKPAAEGEWQHRSEGDVEGSKYDARPRAGKRRQKTDA